MFIKLTQVFTNYFWLLSRFLKLDYDSTRPLTLWGAGNKGKTIAKTLIENEVPFDWICDNPSCEVPFRFLKQIKNPQSIITVANAEAQKQNKKLSKEIRTPIYEGLFFLLLKKISIKR